MALSESIVRQLKSACVISAIAHMLAGILMATWLRPVLASDGEIRTRILHLVAHQWQWQVGWLVWIAADFCMLYFCLCCQKVFFNTGDKNLVARLKLPLSACILAASFDVTGETIAILLLPKVAHHYGQVVLAATAADLEAKFMMVYGLFLFFTALLANGFYTLTAAVITRGARHCVSAWASWLGWLVVVAGVGISITSILNHLPGQIISNALLVPALAGWQIGIACTLSLRAKPSAE